MALVGKFRFPALKPSNQDISAQPLLPKQLCLGALTSNLHQDRSISLDHCDQTHMTSIQGFATKLGLTSGKQSRAFSVKEQKTKEANKTRPYPFLKNWKAEHFLTGNPFMSLFTIFYSGSSRLTDPGWPPPGQCIWFPTCLLD